MKKILLFIESLGSGGAERQLCGLALMLANRGYNIKVIYYANKSFYKGILDEEGVESQMLPKLCNKILRPLRIANIIKKEKPDCIISFLSSVNVSVCLAKMFCRCNRLIVSERNTNQTTSFKDIITFNLYRWADLVVPNSFSQEKYIKDNFPFLSNKTVVITNFVDSQTFIPSSFKQSNNPPIILTLARYAEQKNCLNYVRAIKKIIDSGFRAHFDWYGKINEQNIYFRKIKNLISELGVESVITLHDQIKDNVSVYQKSDVFCLPSIYEGFPNVLCEAMSCGLPVVCSNVCDNPTIVENCKNGFLFNPHNIDDISETIIRFISLSKAEKMEMARVSREIIETRFSKAEFIEHYIELIEK